MWAKYIVFENKKKRIIVDSPLYVSSADKGDSEMRMMHNNASLARSLLGKQKKQLFWRHIMQVS